MKKLLFLSILISGSIFAEITEDEFNEQMIIRARISSCSSFMNAWRQAQNAVVGITIGRKNQKLIEAVNDGDNCKAIYYWQLGASFDAVKDFPLALECFLKMTPYKIDSYEFSKAVLNKEISVERK